MWALYEAGTLHPASVLTGEFDEPEELADVGGIMREIKAARLDEERHQAVRAADDAPRARPKKRLHRGCSDRLTKNPASAGFFAILLIP